MAKQSGLGDNLYVNGYDLSGDIGSIGTLACPRNPLNVTGINSSANERVLGRADPQIGYNSYFNDAALQSHAAHSPLPTTDVLVSYCRGTSQGSPVGMLTVKQIGYDPTLGSDGSLTQDIQGQGTNANTLEWGVLLTAGMVNHTTGTSTSSVDNAASSASGAAGYLHVNALTGTNVIVTVEDSTNNSDWTTLVAFTSVTSAPAAERVTVAGTVDRYVRITSSGTFSSADFAVGFRRGETTDDVAYA